jgi:hypothetical protein
MSVVERKTRCGALAAGAASPSQCETKPEVRSEKSFEGTLAASQSRLDVGRALRRLDAAGSDHVSCSRARRAPGNPDTAYRTARSPT